MLNIVSTFENIDWMKAVHQYSVHRSTLAESIFWFAQYPFVVMSEL